LTRTARQVAVIDVPKHTVGRGLCPARNLAEELAASANRKQRADDAGEPGHVRLAQLLVIHEAIGEHETREDRRTGLYRRLQIPVDLPPRLAPRCMPPGLVPRLDDLFDRVGQLDQPVLERISRLDYVAEPIEAAKLDPGFRRVLHPPDEVVDLCLIEVPHPVSKRPERRLHVYGMRIEAAVIRPVADNDVAEQLGRRVDAAAMGSEVEQWISTTFRECEAGVDRPRPPAFEGDDVAKVEVLVPHYPADQA